MPGRPSRRKWNRDAAFEYWFGGGGERRTFADVAAKFGVHPDTIREVAKLERWHERADERSAAVIAELNAAMVKTAVERRLESLRILDTVKTRFEARLDDAERAGRYEPTFRDAAEAIRLEQVLARDAPAGVPLRPLEAIEAEIEAMSDEDLLSELETINTIRPLADRNSIGNQGDHTCQQFDMFLTAIRVLAFAV